MVLMVPLIRPQTYQMRNPMVFLTESLMGPQPLMGPKPVDQTVLLMGLLRLPPEIPPPTKLSNLYPS